LFNRKVLMEITETCYARDRSTWRKWLEKHHESFREVWLVYYKKHTGKPTVSYNDAVEEALCFGWIDSTVKRIDEEKYAQKFTPRKKNSKWSDWNKKRIKKLLAEGTMAPAGLKAIENVDLTIEPKSEQKELVIPDYIIEGLASNNKAFEFFSNLSPSRKRMFVGWIDSAKKEETRQRRLLETIRLCSENKLLPMM